MIRGLVLAGIALVALTSSAAAAELLAPLIISAVSAAGAGTISTGLATGIASIALGAATVSTSRTLLTLERQS